MKKEINKEIKTKSVEAVGMTVTESISSVELTRTAGGEIRPKVKVYNQDPDKAMAKAKEIMDKLNKEYVVNE